MKKGKERPEDNKGPFYTKGRIASKWSRQPDNLDRYVLLITPHVGIHAGALPLTSHCFDQGEHEYLNHILQPKL